MSKLVFTFIGIGIAEICIVVFAIFPLTASVHALATTMDQHRTTIALNQLQQRESAVTVRALDTLQTVSTTLNEGLLQESNVQSFIAAFDAIAAHEGVALVVKDLKSPDTIAALSPLTVTLQGAYSNCMHALTAIQALPYFITIQHITADAQQLGATPTVQLTITATVAWL